MARDPVGVLLAIRLHAVEQARSALAVCLTSEAALTDRIKALDTAVLRDRETAGSWQDAHQFVEISVFRQGAVRAERRTIAADLEAAEARSAEARGVVTAARAAAEAVGQLIAERQAAGQAEAARRDQHVLDDIARARLTMRRRAEAMEPVAPIVPSPDRPWNDRE
jgi:hypothetical protein